MHEVIIVAQDVQTAFIKVHMMAFGESTQISEILPLPLRLSIAEAIGGILEQKCVITVSV